MQSKIYCDYNSFVPVDPEISAKLERFFSEASMFNPSSQHSGGRDSRAVIDRAATKVRSVLELNSHNVIFTSGGTEACHLALECLSGDFPILINPTEHSCVLDYVKKLKGAGEIDWIPVNQDGIVDLDYIEAKLKEKPFLVVIMGANNETGAIQPVEKISKICSNYGAYFFCDYIARLGKEETWQPLGKHAPACYAISGHKTGAGFGSGLLLMPKSYKFFPLRSGGGQQLGIRPGTENPVAAFAISESLEMLSKREAENKEIQILRDKIESFLRKLKPNIKFWSENAPRTVNTSLFSIQGVKAASMIIKADLSGLAISAGSACSSGSSKASHVVMAMSASKEDALSAIRLSLGKSNLTREDELFKKLEKVFGEAE